VRKLSREITVILDRRTQQESPALCGFPDRAGLKGARVGGGYAATNAEGGAAALLSTNLGDASTAV